jgi:hypothetical protein
MKNTLSTTPGFVLTSLSFKNSVREKVALPNERPFTASHRSSIAKFDYCLPPEESITTGNAGTNSHAL